MRKTLLTLLIVSIAVGVGVASWASYAQHDNAYRVSRAQKLVREIQQLAIGKSDYHAAEAIAREFGNAPPPEGRDYYKENCAAREHIENCTFLVSLNDSPMETVYLRHPSLPHLGAEDWWGYAEISMANGTVLQYSFWVWYKASDGNWRGFARRESQALPQYELVDAHISDSYSIQRIDFKRKNGFGLQSSLTPRATQAERQRASRFDFACLAQKQGCGEICEVMPDAWRDFYEARGHLDVEKLGPGYLFCSEPPK